MADSKLPPKDKKELDRIKKLFEEGLDAASKDPDRIEEIRRERDNLVKPWEKALKVWQMSDRDIEKARKERDGKKASLVTARQVVSRFLKEDK